MLSALKSLQSCWVCSIWGRCWERWDGCSYRKGEKNGVLISVLHMTGWGVGATGERAGLGLAGSGFVGEKDTAKIKKLLKNA